MFYYTGGAVVNGWAYAAKLPGGEVQATGMQSTGASVKRGGPARGPPYPHFSYLSLNIQAMFLSGVAQYPAERTLLVTGAYALALSPYLQPAASFFLLASSRLSCSSARQRLQLSSAVVATERAGVCIHVPVLDACDFHND